MRFLIFILTATIGLALTPVHAQSSDPMDVQRCIWGCLANSKGNNDPAYHSCVKEFCAEPVQSSNDQANKQSLATDRQTVLFVQRGLAARGFDPGPADGVYGRRTAAAVKAFQGSQGMPQSGVIDDAVISALRSTN